jgi:hypothetical protein
VQEKRLKRLRVATATRKKARRKTRLMGAGQYKTRR